MPNWTKHDKANIGRGNGVRDGSGTYACPICWNVNKGYENGHRLTGIESCCPICKVELNWKDNAKSS
jgi:hypothetical protein